mmetsp:Transcript_20962/g.45314  ORF Transcript_20962/g.45314 Transcript_20962/m.45314 type:complete len:184 (+) Transcript_20962:76-627(+)
MSVDLLLTDYHTAWRQLIEKERDYQHRAAVQTYGEPELRRLQQAGSEVLQRSASALAFRNVTGLLPHQMIEEGDQDRERREALRQQRRREKIQQKVQQEVSAKEQQVRSELRQEGAQLRRLRKELQTQWASDRAREGPQPAKAASCFRPDLGKLDLRPIPDPPKRFVAQVAVNNTGLRSYLMM